MSINKNDLNHPIYAIEDDEPSDAPLYSLPDDDLNPHVNSKYNPKSEYEEEYDDDEEYDEYEEDETTAAESIINKKISPFAVLIKTMLTPVEGWKALKRARFKTDEVASKCFYPLIGLASASELSRMFYEANVSFADWVVDGMTTFITFFFGYFTLLLAGGVVLPRKSRELLKKDIGKQFIMLLLSTLAIFYTIIKLLPMLDPVLVFLPLWSIYLAYKGVRVIRVNKEVENSTTGLICMLMIGAPLLWNWLLTELLLPATIK